MKALIVVMALLSPLGGAAELAINAQPLEKGLIERD